MRKAASNSATDLITTFHLYVTHLLSQPYLNEVEKQFIDTFSSVSSYCISIMQHFTTRISSHLHKHDRYYQQVYCKIDTAGKKLIMH